MTKGIKARPLYVSPDAVATAFYEAFEAGDLEAMMAVWAEDEELVCVHPGGARIVGYDAVRTSWEQVFAGGARLSFRVEGPIAVETVGLAMQSVVEHITVGNEPRPRGSTIATNVYLRTPSGWRMVMHHASSAPAVPEPDETPRHLH